MTRGLLAAAAAAVGLLVFTATAGADTLGIAAPPAGATEGTCFGPVVGQYTDDPTTRFTMPSTGEITQWQSYTHGDIPGSDLSLVVLRPGGGGSFNTVGVDNEAVPNPLPGNGVASFALATPIQVEAGDILALYSNAPNTCFYEGGSVPAADSLFALMGGTLPPAPGQALSLAGPTSPSGLELDLGVTFLAPGDAAVTTSTLPSPALAGGAAVLASTVTNNGPGVGQITFVDQVPAGLQILSAAAGLGSCSTSGQTVSCTITGLPAGQSVPVDVVVTAASAGSYPNIVSVAGASDPNPANNTAVATLVISAPSSTITPQQQIQRCVVPQLRDTPLSVARRVLGDLGCRVRLVHRHSAVVRGRVIGVRGRTGRYGYHRLITLIVSSGKKPGSKHHTRKH